MKAIVYREYGTPDVLACAEVPIPNPGDGELLVKVHAAAVNALDLHFMRGRPFAMRLAMGLRRPRRNRPGVDVAGVVHSVGPGVTQFRPGDPVFGGADGALAEYALTTERRLAHKPPDLSFEAAAAIPVAGITALQGLRDRGGLQAGQKVLVNGAAGGIGTFAVQIAKAMGAEVTGICSGRNVALVREIGADRVIDYRQEDFTRLDDRFDLILDIVGNRRFSECRHILSPGGRMIAAGGVAHNERMGRHMARLALDLIRSRFGDRRLVFFVTRGRAEDLAELGRLTATGALRPVIGGTYPLERAGDALRELATGHARGKIVVSMPERGGASAP